MKKVILLAASLFSLTVVNAQSAPATTATSSTERQAKTKLTPEQRAQKQTDDLNAIVVLTDDQKPKVYDLCLAKVKQSEDIRTKYKGATDKSQEGADMKAVKQAFRKNVKALLTPDQNQKLEAKEKEMKANGKGDAPAKE